MHEDLFWKLLKEIAHDTNPADVEPELKSRIKQKSARSHADFDKVSYEIMLSGAGLFQNESQKLAFTSALNAQHTVCNFEDFIAHCVPQLVDGYQKRKSNSRQRSITGPKQKRSAPQRVSKSFSQSIGEKGSGGALAINNQMRPPSSRPQYKMG
jgi:hypothetical protein